jgi:hypothetical protein
MYYEARNFLFVRKSPRIPGSATLGLLRVRDELTRRVLGNKKPPLRSLVVLFSRNQGSRKLANAPALAERLRAWLPATFGTHFEFVHVDPATWTMKESIEKMSR